MTIKESIEDILPDEISEVVEPICTISSAIWEKLKNPITVIEIGAVSCILVLAYFAQKWLQKRYYSYTQKPGLLFTSISFLLAYSAPLIAFFFFFLAMSLMASITSDLRIFEVAIKICLIWLIWRIAMRIITDFAVRCIVTVTLGPLLILSALGLATPVLDYLDSLGFTIGGVYLSVYLLFKTIFIATCIFGGGRLLSQAVVSLIRGQKKVNEEIKDLLENIFQIVWYSILTIITMNLVGIDLKALALFGGAVGVGVGIGLQKIAANFISGIIILFEQSIKVGHLVEIQGGYTGWIRHLGARAAVLEIGDGREVIVPNEDLITKSLTDWTYRDRRARAEVFLTVTYESDLNRVREIILDVLTNHPLCSRSSVSQCFLLRFTDLGAQFVVRFWVDDLTGKESLQHDVLISIWKRFKEEGIEIPSPQWDLVYNKQTQKK